MLEYTLVRSKRKTAVIQIAKNAEVYVRVPLNMQKQDIDRFVNSKQNWIINNVEKRRRQIEQKSIFKLNYGDFLNLCGNHFRIVAKEGTTAGFDGNCFYLPQGLTSESIKNYVVKIYKKLAKSILTDKVKKYGEIMNLSAASVKVNSAKTRWGSCSTKNCINFSWQLIMGEESVIDYVVVHELSHIVEHNHSDRFWKIVENVLPDYRIRQYKLKELQKRLSTQNWDI